MTTKYHTILVYIAGWCTRPAPDSAVDGTAYVTSAEAFIFWLARLQVEKEE